MKAMIFAAGMGTRLKPLTDTMPKALVPVGGRPLLRIVMERLIEAGITDVVINVHHFADQIVDYVKRNDGFGSNVQFSDESAQLLDTGGGLKKAAPMLRGIRPVLVHNVDILSDVDLRMFTSELMGGAQLLVSDRKTKRYLLFNDALRLVGWTNIETGEVKSPYSDLDPEKYQHLAFDGVHFFSPTLFPRMESWPDKFSIIDFYLSVCKEVPIYGYVQPGLHVLDVGKVDTLKQAEDFLQGNL
jgi:NDP-sugar pyrophosphorylase family protein